MMLILVTAAAALGVLYLVVPWIGLKFLRRALVRRVAARGRICLTFDDGPDPEATPAVLDVLRSAGAKATFFLRGRQIERHAPTVAAIVAEGHEVGEHGYDHLHAWKAGPFASLADLMRGARAAAPYCQSGRRRLVRPPYGKVTLLTLLWCLVTRRVIVPWTVDPRDYAASDSIQVARHVCERLQPGAVVLFHDGRVRPDSSPPRVTVAALAAVIETEPARMVTVGDALWGPPAAGAPVQSALVGAVGGHDDKAYNKLTR